MRKEDPSPAQLDRTSPLYVSPSDVRTATMMTKEVVLELVVQEAVKG